MKCLTLSRMLGLYLVSLLLFTVSSDALAVHSDWVEVAPEVKLRLISDNVLARDGTFKVGLHIRMPQHVKTYWRVPGDTGIPAHFDHKQSINLESLVLHWPYPVRDIDNGKITHVYHGEIVLPFTARAVNANVPVAVHLQAQLGLCSDICVPVQADLMLNVDLSKQDSSAGSLLRVWEARTPISWPDDENPPFTQINASKDGRALELVLQEGIEFDDLFVEGETRDWIFGRPQKRPGSLLVNVPLLNPKEGQQLKDASLRLTFGTKDGPYEVFWNSKMGLFYPLTVQTRIER